MTNYSFTDGHNNFNNVVCDSHLMHNTLSCIYTRLHVCVILMSHTNTHIIMSYTVPCCCVHVQMQLFVIIYRIVHILLQLESPNHTVIPIDTAKQVYRHTYTHSTVKSIHTLTHSHTHIHSLYSLLHCNCILCVCCLQPPNSKYQASCSKGSDSEGVREWGLTLYKWPFPLLGFLGYYM